MRPLRIHATNLNGMGSRRLAEALLPPLLAQAGERVELYLAAGDNLATIVHDPSHHVVSVSRNLPNALSRFFEVTGGARRFRGEGDLLVLGDMPLMGIPNQTVLVHNLFLIEPSQTHRGIERAKFHILRQTFARNERSAKTFIVQTPGMRRGLIDRYGIADDRIAVIGQPPPEAVRSLPKRSASPEPATGVRPLSLFYPSRLYPHKRHDLLTDALLDPLARLASQVVLTVDPKELPSSDHRVLKCIGEVDMARVAHEYTVADALLFLSSAESYGLPLLEAMWLDLPIVCPDLPYARDILGENEFFFKLSEPHSLIETLARLQAALARGWRADWSNRRKLFPQSWSEVASRFMEIVRT